MFNKDIVKILKSMATLMEIHDENSFKIAGIRNAAFAIEKLESEIAETPEHVLESIKGIGKGMMAKIQELQQTGTLQEYEHLLKNTPQGVIEMLEIKGLGPKKVQHIWKEMQIESLEALQQACETGIVAAQKGFGEKIKQEILDSIAFRQSVKGSLHIDDAWNIWTLLDRELPHILADEYVLVGQLPQYEPTVSSIEILVQDTHRTKSLENLYSWSAVEPIFTASSPYRFTCHLAKHHIKVVFYFTSENNFFRQQYLRTASPSHLLKKGKEIGIESDLTVGQCLHTAMGNSLSGWSSEAKSGIVPPHMRSGMAEKIWLQNPSAIVSENDIHGILHLHTTYSDGKHSLLQMAEAARLKGYGYIGVTDHSQTAAYASGLTPDRVKKQWDEINALVTKLPGFTIFKGIESDILGDGALDYDPDILSGFDFVIASVHQNLQMDIEKAHSRIIKAIENPYCTILGHPTGRLLLRRAGYPIDHTYIIDACAANGVAIEINSDPWRLDLDYRWIPYAMEKGVYISINPDAHEVDGYDNLRWGVYLGQKAGLTKDLTLNAMDANTLSTFFKQKNKKKTYAS